MPRRPGMELVVRATHERKIAGEEFEYLHAALEAAEVLGKMQVEVPRSRKRKERTAKLEVRACSVTLVPPRNHLGRGDLSPVSVSVVRVLETETVPRGRRADRVDDHHHRSGPQLGRSGRDRQSLCAALEGGALPLRAEERLRDGGSAAGKRGSYRARAGDVQRGRVEAAVHDLRGPNCPARQCSRTTSGRRCTWSAPPGHARCRRSRRRCARRCGWWRCSAASLGRKRDGEPGVQSLWTGFRRLMDFTLALRRLRLATTCG